MTKIKDILLAGAMGDAFGYQIEFDTIESIQNRFGNKGLLEFLNPKPIASDDTQMSIFAMDALRSCFDTGITDSTDILARIEEYYLDWYLTQTDSFRNASEAFFELTKTNAVLWARRAPGNTCLSALNALEKNEFPTDNPLYAPINDSYGCGAVMRTAPVITLYDNGYSLEQVCDMAIKQGALTHGHSKGYLPSAVFVNFLINADKQSIEEIIESSKTILKNYKNAEETIKGLELLQTTLSAPHTLQFDELISTFGNGFDGLSAVLIGVYSAYKNDSLEQTIVHSSNHSGDSDSTAILAAQLYMAKNYETASQEIFYQTYKDKIDLSAVIENVCALPQNKKIKNIL